MIYNIFLRFIITSLFSVEELIKKAVSTIGFLRMQTPKRKSGHRLTNIEQEKIEKEKIANAENSTKPTDLIKTKPTSNWTGSNMDPDMVARHDRSLKRAGFRDNAHAKGRF
jgi:hypothetical protein